jgi:hypothetical protein
MITKICSKCLKDKPVIEFYKVNGKYPKDGYFSWCKDCCRKHQKKYKEQKRLYMIGYRRKNIDKTKEWRRRNKEWLREYERERYYKDKGRYKEQARKANFCTKCFPYAKQIAGIFHPLGPAVLCKNCKSEVKQGQLIVAMILDKKEKENGLESGQEKK